MIPQIGTNTLGLQEEERESREHFSKITTKSNKGDTDSDVKTTSSSKKLSGHLHGSMLPETPTVCRDTPSPTLTVNANRNK